MKGIVLAGGSGTRLHPLTLAASKQLMPVYDKPMIYYPISTLIEAGIREILIITTPQDKESFSKLLGDGSSIGCQFKYAVQEKPNGLAEAFIIGEEFIGTDPVCLILGDNIFYSSDLSKILKSARMEWDGHRGIAPASGALVFAYHVSDPERYGVVDFDAKGKVTSIEEKPRDPKSNFAIPGLYFYDNKVIQIAKNLKPSSRGELEITDVNREYLHKNSLHVKIMKRGTAWLDTGTFHSLMQAGQFVQVIEERQGLKVGCIEESAYRQGWIDDEQLRELANKFEKSGYGNYLYQVLLSKKYEVSV
jgi:glucose-1-phosphate thymidylyltransferase